MEVEKAVFQVTVSLSIRKDRVARLSPLPIGMQREAQTSSKIAWSTSKF